MKHELLMVREGNCLKPADSMSLEQFQQVRTTKPVLVTIHHARNPEHHEKLWAIATRVADFDDDFSDAEDAIEWAKLHMPTMRQFRTLRDGTVLCTTKSIAFASMDQIKFERFYDRALWLWSQKIGCDPEALLDPPAAA